MGNNRAIIEITRLLTNTRYTLLDLIAIVHTQITCNELRTDTGITFHCTTDTQVYDGHDIGHSDPDCTLTIHRDQVTVD